MRNDPNRAAAEGMPTAAPSNKPYKVIPDLTGLEGRIGDLVRLTRIADDFVERTLSYEHGEVVAAGYRRFLLSEHELEVVSFLLGEVQYRARLLSEEFYAGLEAAR